ncbi:xylulokinase [Rossellomorea vietnamensis]|uniref:Xylulose kinase n=1 Tax=Rossellomorea vietnamensis TaxID=218284 RepID=A0A5D4K9Z7_9BACI|nr:xylulokinase [Rossellomorea vietnamensis]TYR73540.1 xylulokinase [Rossellomorea vietnamensis]
MKYVIGIDLGTSAVKILLVNQKGEVSNEVSKEYPLIIEKSGYSEQDPEEWVEKTREGLAELISDFPGDVKDIEGISFSGQMHGLVLVNESHQVLRNAILWNDTRTTKQCQEIYETMGRDRLLQITKNPALEGFTLPKILWVQENEPEIFSRASTFMLPKDYLRFRMTGKVHMEYSDAAGTLMLNVAERQWSREILNSFHLTAEFCPELIESHELVGSITSEFSQRTGLSQETKVFAGGADNACGAIGSGILSEGRTLCSIGTSGVVLSYEERSDLDFEGKVHYFNHGEQDSFYTMGVTLAAGYSLSWYKDTFAKEESFQQFLTGIEEVPAGSNGLVFTPYIVGERTPHADSTIRGSFIGIDASHERKHFSRAVLEGITFSLNESIEVFRNSGKTIDTIISIGGGAKNETWLQMQADIFNSSIEKLASEQGPGMGAAMLAAFGCGWYPTLKECAKDFISVSKTYEPIPENVETYKKVFAVYQEIYNQTREMNERLREFRK